MAKQSEGKSWFSITAKAGEVPEVMIYDVVGLFGIEAADFDAALRPHRSAPKVNVRINSPGGNVFVGIAIFNMLKRLTGEVVVYIDGVAASIASYIAMVGKRVVMPENAMMMIHNPSAHQGGTAEQMRKTAQTLDNVRESMITAYAEKSGLSREAIAEIMDAETWFTAAEAVEKGFADAIEGKVEMSNLSRFDFSNFHNPPKALAEGSAQPEESEMTKEEIAAAVAEGNKPVLEALGALTTSLTALAPKEQTTQTQQDQPDPIAEAAAYADEITSLCTIAGHPEKVAGFLQAKTPVADVRAELAKLKTTTTTAQTTALQNHNVGPDGKPYDHSDLVVTALDYNAIWADYHKQGEGRSAH